MTTSPAERRRPQASVLRLFFQEQWTHLAAVLVGRQRISYADRAELERALESLVEGTDTRMRMIMSYRRRLRSGVRCVLDYVERLVAALPPPMPLDGRALGREPLAAALFAGPEDLKRTVSQSSAVQAFLARQCLGGDSSFCAVLTATPWQKRILGTALDGDQLLHDVVQTAMNFSDRRLEYPAMEEGEVRVSVERYLYESLVSALRSRLAAADGADSAPRDPDDYLDELSSLLLRPEELLSVENRRLRVSKRGILLEAPSNEPANEFEFGELVLEGAPRRLIRLVRYPVAEVIDHESLCDPALRSLGLFRRD